MMIGVSWTWRLTLAWPLCPLVFFWLLYHLDSLPSLLRDVVLVAIIFSMTPLMPMRCQFSGTSWKMIGLLLLLADVKRGSSVRSHNLEKEKSLLSCRNSSTMFLP